MDTTAAAAQASVTVDTIRHWARMGVIRAAKVAGRWVISAASLARRIALGRKETTVDHITRTDYETACAQRGWTAYPDNQLHGNIPAGIYADQGDMDEREQLDYRRALAVVAEKDAGTWTAPAKKQGKGCHYCGVPITRRDGECEDCGSQTTVARYMDGL